MRLKAKLDDWRLDDEINATIARGLGYKVERAGDLWKVWPPGVKPDNSNWLQLEDYQNSIRNSAEAFRKLGMGVQKIYLREGKYVCQFEHHGAKMETPPMNTPAWAAAYALYFACYDHSHQ